MVSTANGEIFVQVRGPDAGAPVILVPGPVAWSGFWLGVADELGAMGYRVIAVDLPPFGFSARSPTGSYSRADQAARLAALIEALGLKNAIVVGHSFGAGAVVELAMAHPDALAGMVLIDPVLGLPADGQGVATDHPILRWLLDQPLIGQPLVAATLVNPLLTRPLLTSLVYHKEAATQHQADILAIPLTRAGTTASYARWLPYLLLPETSAISATPAAYAKIKTPTAMIWGYRDRVAPFEEGKRLLGLIPGSTLEMFDDVGHIPHIEDQADFLWMLGRNLTAVAQRGHRTLRAVTEQGRPTVIEDGDESIGRVGRDRGRLPRLLVISPSSPPHLLVTSPSASATMPKSP
jgi:pimeloyl-ACP methyl ester carboxylesterase